MDEIKGISCVSPQSLSCIGFGFLGDKVIIEKLDLGELGILGLRFLVQDLLIVEWLGSLLGFDHLGRLDFLFGWQLR